MSKNLHSHLRYESSQAQLKDNVISTLKRELFELKDLEHDFMRLNDEVANIQSKYALLLDQKQRMENQHRLKGQMSKQNLSELRNDVDHLKMQIHKMNVQIQDTIRQNSTLKRICENRETQITALLTSNRQMEKNNQIQGEENKNLSLTLKNLKDQRNKAEEESEKLNVLLNDSISNLKQLQKQARQLQISNSKLDAILAQAEKDHTHLLDEMKVREQELNSSNRKLQELADEGNDLKQANRRLDLQCNKTEQQYSELCQRLDSTVHRNKQMGEQLKSLQNTLRITESDLDQAIIKRESLKKQNTDLSNENKLANQQVDQCLMSILEYERINKQLQKQIENYISCDEEARCMLNRKEGMRVLLDQVSGRLAKTEQQIAHLR